MATIPIKQKPGPQPTDSLEQRFRQLADVWQEEVAHHSSTTIRNSHPAYRAIIGLGTQVVPYLLRDMQEHQTHWFAALREITGADPIPTSAAGNVPEMVEACLRWAQDNDYEW
jgi:hypothetical protein